jgi:hypothetical protein
MMHTLNRIVTWFFAHPFALLLLILAISLIIILDINNIMTKRKGAESRSEWGFVVSTHTGRCPECDGKTIHSVYESGVIETNCTICDYYGLK